MSDGDLAAALEGATWDTVLDVLNGWTAVIDWAALPGRTRLADDTSVTFDRRRRTVGLETPEGGLLELDLGRRDRIRPVAAILTADLTRQDGPTFAITEKVEHGFAHSDVAVRDPLDPKGKRATDPLAVGEHQVARWVDADGRPVLFAVGDVDRTSVTEFFTFLMDGSAGFARLRSTSGLGCFHDARRASFRSAVTPEVAELARADGFALVTTKAGPIGVVFDCGAPGEYAALAAYGTGLSGLRGPRGIVVDLRRPAPRDGAIVDPPG